MRRSLPAEPAELLCQPVPAARSPGSVRPGRELYCGPSRHRGLILAALELYPPGIGLGGLGADGACSSVDNRKKSRPAFSP